VTADQPDAIWVVSDVAPDGTYVVTVQAGPDHAVTLTRAEAIAYATAVFEAAVRAEHDAAVLAQLTATGMTAELAATVVIGLREDRPMLDDLGDPLTFEPIVTAARREPALLVSRGGVRIAQWTPADARDHAGNVLSVLAAADLDGAYRRLLVGSIGLDDDRACALVGQLSRYLSA